MSVEYEINGRKVNIDDELWEAYDRVVKAREAEGEPDMGFNYLLRHGRLYVSELDKMDTKDIDRVVNKAMYEGLCHYSESREYLDASDGKWGRYRKRIGRRYAVEDFLQEAVMKLFNAIICLSPIVFVVTMVLKLVGAISWSIWICLIPLWVFLFTLICGSLSFFALLVAFFKELGRN